MKNQYYACWQKPNWFRRARKGPLSRENALAECRLQHKRGMELVWLEDMEGNKTRFVGQTA